MARFDPKAVERLCLDLPGATLVVQWGDCRVYKTGGKMFAMLVPDRKKPMELWFKASDLSARLLIDLAGVRPAPYLARAGWLAVTRSSALGRKDIDAYLGNAHALVFAKLPRKTQAAIASGETPAAPKPSARRKKRLADVAKRQ